jgi:hypothetical protein
MPVPKRAARPTAASASDDPRDPQPSDNDFTILFRRVSSRVFNAPPPAPRRVEPPKPPPKPPVSHRSRRPPAPGSDRPTPMVMATPPEETVIVRPTIRTLLLRITVFLTLGCGLGVGVEALVRGDRGVAQAPLTSSNAASSPPPSPGDARARVTIEPREDERVALARIVHRHHAHHTSASSPSRAAQSPPPASTAAAENEGADAGDDLSAAMQILTKAKEEVTIP